MHERGLIVLLAVALGLVLLLLWRMRGDVACAYDRLEHLEALVADRWKGEEEGSTATPASFDAAINRLLTKQRRLLEAGKEWDAIQVANCITRLRAARQELEKHTPAAP